MILMKQQSREKMLLQADPDFLENSIQLTSEYESRYACYKSKLNELLNICKEKNIAVTILVIPASCQVDESYKNNYSAIGAALPKTSCSDTLYPFLDRLTIDLKNEHVTIVNALRYFQLVDCAQYRLFYSNDIHLNKYGQMEIARCLLQQKGIR